MVKDSKFWVGVLAGVVLCWVYRTYVAKKAQG